MIAQQAPTIGGGTGVAPGAGSGDHALEMLLDLETRVSGLKRLHEHLAQREQQIAAREAGIAERERQAQQEEEDFLARAAAAEAEQRARAAAAEENIRNRAREAEEKAQARLAAAEEELRARAATLEQQARAKMEAADAEHQARLAEAERTRAAVESDRLEHEVNAAALRAERDEVALKRRKVQEAMEESERKRRAAEQSARALLEREQGLAQKEQELEERERGVTERDISYKDIERVLDERDSRVAEREHAAETRERWLTERERAIVDREKTVETSAAEQERVAAEVESKLTRGREQERTLDEREADLARRERSASEAERLVTELAQREKELAAISDRLTAKEAELKEQDDKLQRDRAAVSEQAETLAQRAADAESAGAAIFAGRVEQIQLELGEARAAKAAIAMELAQAQEQVALLTARVEGVAAGTAEQSQETAGLRGRITEMEIELEASRAAVMRAEKNARRAESETGENLDRATESAEAARAAMAEQERKLSETQAALERMTREAESLRTTVTQLRDRAERTASGMPGDAPADADEVEKRDQAIALLRDRLERIQGENATLTRKVQEAEDRAANAATQVPAARDDGDGAQSREREQGPTDSVLHSMQRRHHRLRTYKALLQGQARKIVAAQNALQKRHLDCEQVLAQRSRLAQAAADVARREKRAVSTKARSGAAATLLYIVATLGIVLVLSWEVSKRVWPGTYVARATVEADTRGKRTVPDALAQWQQDHEAMLKDPRLMEFAAERFSRRGLAGMARAAELQERLKRDLYVQSGQPGSMTIELRGEGAERTAMELDTFVTSLKSLADMSRDERASTLGLVVSSQAVAGQEPLTDQRLQYAGIVFGVGAVGSLALGGFLWWRLSRSKKRFEHAQAVETALEEVDWAALEKTFKKSAHAETQEAERLAA